MSNTGAEGTGLDLKETTYRPQLVRGFNAARPAGYNPMRMTQGTPSAPEMTIVQGRDNARLKLPEEKPPPDVIIEDGAVRSASGTSLDVKAWDVFRLLPPLPDDVSRGFWVDLSLQLLKLITYPLVFILTIASAVACKATFLLMTSASGFGGYNRTLCGYIPLPGLDPLIGNITVHVDNKHIVKYVWSVFLTLCAPELFCFIRCLHRVFFRNVRKPSVGQFFLMPKRRKTDYGRKSRHYRAKDKYRHGQMDCMTASETSESDSEPEILPLPGTSGTGAYVDGEYSDEEESPNAHAIVPNNTEGGSLETENHGKDSHIYLGVVDDIPTAKIEPNLDSSASDNDSDADATSSINGEDNWSQETDDQPPTYQHCGTVFASKCVHCNAYRFKDDLERPGFCCAKGKICLDPIPELPTEIQGLYEDRGYINNIRSYNNALAMASMLCTQVNQPGFNPIIRIHGKVHHLIGDWLPQPGQKPVFAQLYFHDPEAEVLNRCRSAILKPTIVSLLQRVIRSENRIVQELDVAVGLAKSADRDYDIVLLSQPGQARNYDLPGSNEIAALVQGNQAHHFDVVLKKNSGKLERINELHPLYDPLHYVLLFPKGTPGYSYGQQDRNDRKVTMAEFYAFHFQLRDGSFNHILRSRRLTQQLFCDMLAKIIGYRLKWVEKNQHQIRAEKYNGLMDAVHNDDQQNAGRSIILPPSITGSDRWYAEAFQDAMALVRRKGKPDFFITMTCNPRWPEILESLYPGESPADRPDLVVRVFHIKVQQLLTLLVKDAIFGQVAAYTCVKEDQKRGLPHVHILLINEKGCKPKNGDDVAKFVSAEIPDPHNTVLFDMVRRHMIHGPCGKDINEKSPCMRNGKCSKGFPKALVADTTTFNIESSAVLQRRPPPAGGQSFQLKMSNGVDFSVDNRWVVPYNPHLLLAFNAHINVETVNSAKSVKYVYKYICKGTDKATFSVTANNGTRNEIEDFLNGRYIGSTEAIWTLFGFEPVKKWPPVVKLALHLQGEQLITFQPEEAKALVASGPPETKLTAYYKLNREDPSARDITYPDLPRRYRWEKSKKKWISRKIRMRGTTGGDADKSPAVGRIPVIALNHRQKELYFLRILLHHVLGPTCEDDLRMVDGEKLPTFQEACIRRGLVRNNKELDQVLTEATTCRFGSILRTLFAFLLIFCSPENPTDLWDRHKRSLSEDIMRTKEVDELTEGVLCEALNDINQTLIDNNFDLCKDFGFPPFNRSVSVTPSFLLDELNYNVDMLKDIHRANMATMTDEQSEIFKKVTKAVKSKSGQCFALDARAGSGKTFAITTILAYLRMHKKIALATAVSGIAAILLPNGRTLHSRCKVPLQLDEASTCGLSKRDGPGKLLMEADLLVIDEVTMGHRFMFEALDRSLQFLRDNLQLFGGLTVLFSGDWRQVLPVVPKGRRADIVNATLKNSYIWKATTKLKLSINMRVKQLADPRNAEFAQLLNDIGENNIGEAKAPGLPKTFVVPDDMTLPGNNLAELQSFVFGSDFNTKERCILTPYNEDVNMVNDTILKQFPGNIETKLSADTLLDESEAINYPMELLNKIECSGMPSHALKLKKGCPVMLLRNLNPTKGHCNGTRYAVNNVLQNVIDLTITTGMYVGRSVLIPRIPFSTNDKTLPFNMTRLQYPLRLCFAMTIYKGQGQSLDKVGLYLKNQVFSHGQIYVALSRVKSRDGVKVVSNKNDRGQVTIDNVVYDEILDKE